MDGKPENQNIATSGKLIFTLFLIFFIIGDVWGDVPEWLRDCS